MILIIDNFDSFTYNLVQAIEALGTPTKVTRNNAITIEEIKYLAPDYILISPGPGRPENAGISKSVIESFSGRIPLLGVCLGHQAIGEVFGARVIHAPRLMHGKTSEVFWEPSTLFTQVSSPFQAARYHSLILDPTTIPKEFRITAQTSESEIMAIEHRTLPIYGIQFHPESILTPEGNQIIKNFLSAHAPSPTQTSKQSIKKQGQKKGQ